MDEETQKKLIEVAHQALKLSKLKPVQQSLFLFIHKAYLAPSSASDYPSDSQLAQQQIEIEKATKKYMSTLRSCGWLGKVYMRKMHKVLEWNKLWKQMIEENKGSLKPKSGKPEDTRLHWYISEMAGWYEEVIGKKPGYGSNSIFPRLIRACLAVIDSDRIDARPPYKAIKNTLIYLQKLSPGPIAAYSEWG